MPPRSIFEYVAAFCYSLREANAPISAFFLAVLFPLDIAFSVVGQIGRLYLDPYYSVFADPQGQLIHFSKGSDLEHN